MTALLMTFDVACEGLPDTSIVATAKAYLQGKIEGHKAAFAPTCAEFAVNARKHHNANLPAIPLIEAPAERPVSSEYAKQMAARFDMLSCALKSNRMPAYARWRRRFEKPITVPMYDSE